jgi:penicillin-binding protein 1A
VEPLYIKSVIDRDGRVLEESVPQAIPEEVLSRATPLPTDAELAAKLAQEGYRPGMAALARAAGPGPETGTPDGAGLAESAVAAQGQGGSTGHHGRFPPEDDPAQVIDPKVAFVMTHLLTEVVRFGTGKRAQGLGRQVGAKTGTTNDYKDAWFMGFTPDVVTGVWVGYDDQRSLGPGGTGAKLALPIWFEFMKSVALQYPERRFMVPDGVKLTFIDEKTGKLTDPAAPGAILEAFVEGTEPTEALSPGEEDTGSEGDFLKEDL